jgi:hypothetical protein
MTPDKHILYVNDRSIYEEWGTVKLETTLCFELLCIMKRYPLDVKRFGNISGG